MYKKRASEKGQVVALVALGFVVLLGFSALAIDGGMVYADRRQAQNAADATSLAAAGAGSVGLDAGGIFYENFDCSDFYNGATALGAVHNNLSVAARNRAANNGFAIDYDISDYNGVIAICVDQNHPPLIGDFNRDGLLNSDDDDYDPDREEEVGVCEGQDNDIDDDGIANEDDDDIDGDGQDNQHDDDIDGDGRDNEHDDDIDGDGRDNEDDDDMDGDGQDNQHDDDMDGDGRDNEDDDDMDGDGRDNEHDDDIDGDGIDNEHDDDMDGDGIDNDHDDDRDGDGRDNEDEDEGDRDGGHDREEDDYDRDIDGDGRDNEDDDDMDGDGVDNVNDDDIDGDCIRNEDDDDMDGDGSLNIDDDDMDGDGEDNEHDDDRDGDGIDNDHDDDIDGDGIDNDHDDDIDGDGVDNHQDDDMDGDGIDNDHDDDDDNDGIDDNHDDIDHDGLDSDEDDDDDGDGIRDEDDDDMDGDGIDNEDDDDMDGDGVDNDHDDDRDGDGINDEHDNDLDGDGINNEDDNDIDGDGILNDVDDDDDGDGINDTQDEDRDNNSINDIVEVEIDAGEKYIEVITMITDDTDTALIHFVYNGPVRNRVESVVRIRPRTPLALGNAIVSLNPAACQGNQNGLSFHGDALVTVQGSGIFSNGCLRGDGTPTVDASLGGDVSYAGNYSGGSGIFSPAPQLVASQLPTNSYQVPAPDCSDPAANNVSGSAIAGTLSPGLYCVSGDVQINGGTVTGNGVTIVLLDGRMRITGNPFIQLSAPAIGSGADPAIPGIVIYAPESNNNEIQITGDSESYFRGTIFAPGADINLLGNGVSSAFHAQVIGWNVEVGGTADTGIIYFPGEQYHMPPSLDLIR